MRWPHLYPAGIARQFANDANGIKTLLGWLGSHDVARIVFEPTGPYHHRLERRLGEAGLALAKVNPLQAGHFVQAVDTRAKSDAIDAAMLARMGALVTRSIRAITSEAIDEMRELHTARLALMRDRPAAKNREHARRSPLLKRHAAQRLAQIDRQIAAIDAGLKARVQTDPDLGFRFDILVSILSVGVLTAIIMLIEMPELGQFESKQIASLAGLAPQARESGQHRGKRHIRGGRAVLGQALYMPALVATRFNTDMKAEYQALITAGKPAKVAITAVMRKLIILANTLLKANRKWTEKTACSQRIL